MNDLMIDLRGQRVALTSVSYLRGRIAYQGGDYFEFRPDGAGGWMLSQSAEWDCHDPPHVVGRGATLQAAAEDFARSVTRRTGPRPDAPAATRRRDLVAASIDDLVSVLGAATLLGYDDGCTGLTARTGNAIAYALGLSCWSGLHQLQLRQAYLTGRQHRVSERRRDDPRSTVARRPTARHAQPTGSASPRAGAARAVRAPHRAGRAGRASE
jgi:hypothetical protein